MKKETIYLAGGCFWGTEHYMKTIDGVLETKVGYALGEKPLWNPPLKETVTYEEVCNHSGHAEAVEIIFDAEKISLEGVQAIFVPAAFNMTTGPAHWEISFRMRALDNQVFMAGCAPARDMESSYTAWGHSISPILGVRF